MPENNEPAGMAMAYDVGDQRGQMAAIAEWQLEKWRQFARFWRVNYHAENDRIRIVCTWCGPDGGHICWLTDVNRVGFSWEFGQLETQLVSHLRNKHRDLEQRVYYG